MTNALYTIYARSAKKKKRRNKGPNIVSYSDTETQRIVGSHWATALAQGQLGALGKYRIDSNNFFLFHNILWGKTNTSSRGC